MSFLSYIVSWSIALLCSMLALVGADFIFWGVACNLLYLISISLFVFGSKSGFFELETDRWKLEKYGWCYVGTSILATVIGWL